MQQENLNSLELDAVTSTLGQRGLLLTRERGLQLTPAGLDVAHYLLTEFIGTLEARQHLRA
ncbi:hypothetical protein Deipe_4141 (plasmid) [Deinococcus peraridilitoris DSM 19664]|uniref:Transcriptional regulator n=1 Tax=Deinococcus peraridilitoris (strain DSM 19664 / LMG 22246 / CIP 109416 / KR-200) TaxID=937777 RepID=L0A6J7_DEIPD|nr:hypothetical protein Deipe_4141 [Deinococcus peraridilitoris DSM 19664]